MKILHITATHLNPTGGVPVVLKELIAAQNRIDGVTSRILSINAPVDKIQSSYFDYLGNGKIADYLIGNKPDITFIHSFFHPEYAKVAFMMKRMKVPFVIEPHGSFGKMAMSKSHLKKTIANNTLFRTLIHGANAFVFTNEAEKKDSIYKAPLNFVIPNGVVLSEVQSSSDKDAATFNDPIFYYLGRYDIHHKGLDYLFSALDILEENREKINIIFFGTGTKDQISYVRDHVAKYKTINVREAGTILGEEKTKALEEANILVLTSRYEGSPMTILDAFTYGNPCLVTPGTNVADEVQNNNIGWKAELDANSIAKCLIRAREEYSKNGYSYYVRTKQYAIENYSWDKIAVESLKAIETILQSKDFSRRSILPWAQY